MSNDSGSIRWHFFVEDQSDQFHVVDNWKGNLRDFCTLMYIETGAYALTLSIFELPSVCVASRHECARLKIAMTNKCSVILTCAQVSFNTVIYYF